jgi:hypothetical protein
VPQFATADEVHAAIGGMFAEALLDPVVGDQLAASGVVLRLELTEPTSTITVDMPARTVVVGDEPAPKPTMSLKAKADVAHRYWLGEVNVGIAIARGQIRVRGPVPTLISLAGLAKPLFPRYRQRMQPERQD